MVKEHDHFGGKGARCVGARSSFLPWLYVLYALPMIVFLSVTMPPFQVTDEHSHALRADQVSRGGLVSPRLGGYVDGALYAFVRLYREMPFHYEVKHTADIAHAAATLNWAMPDQDENFQNTAQYGPILYLPQVAGIWIGKLAGLNPVWTMLLARLTNGFAGILIAFLAIQICRRGRALMFTTLLLPMTACQFGSASQDPLIISLSLLAVALASRIISEERAAEIWEFALFVVIVLATTLARPSQLALATLGLAFVGRREKITWRKILIAAVGGILAVAWMVMLSKLMPAQPSGASVSGQFRAMIGQPLLLPSALANTLRESGFWLLESLVDRLGWLDTPMPHWYTWTAVGALVCAWLAPGNRPPWFYPAWIGSMTFAAVLIATSGALYTSWTPIGKLTIDGAQGRYLLPVLPLLGWIAPAYARSIARPLALTWVLVVAFPLVSLATLPSVIMMRYYGSWSNMGTVLNILFFG